MYGRTRVGSLLAGTPRVVKLTGDPAYERALRYGLTRLPIDEFQRARDPRIAWLKAVRDADAVGRRAATCARARRCGRFAARWQLVRADRIVVLPNPISVPAVGDRDELRRRHGFEGPTLVVRRPALAPEGARRRAAGARRAARASRSCSPATAPSARGWTRSSASSGSATVSASSARSRAKTVLELLAAADAEVLSSGWENFPHSVVEGLAVGTPVIATGVGGVREIVTDGDNGLLVPPDDPGGARGGDPPLLRRRGAAGAAARRRSRLGRRLRAGARLRAARGAAPGGGARDPAAAAAPGRRGPATASR